MAGFDEPQLGLGTKLQMADSAGTVFTTVANLTSINGPNEETPLVDITDLESTAREYLNGIPDGGEIQATSHYAADDPTHDAATGVKFVHRTKAKRKWRLIFPKALKHEEFDGIITSVSRTTEAGDTPKLNFTVKISGSITEAAVSGGGGG